MFYAQGALFLRDLSERNPEAFSRFLSGIESGTELSRSFEAAYGAPLGALWDAFVARLPSTPR